MWQGKSSPPTLVETKAAVGEIYLRNVFPEIMLPRLVTARELKAQQEQAAARKTKLTSVAIWGGVGAGILLIGFIALR